MSNIKWSGIEQWKYGLTARWYVSAYYGNDIDVDAVGLYDPSSNPTGHGGPTRPFATGDKINQLGFTVAVFDSGFYEFTYVSPSSKIVGDGVVNLKCDFSLSTRASLYNVTAISSNFPALYSANNVLILYGIGNIGRYESLSNVIIVDSTISGAPGSIKLNNVVVINCSGSFNINVTQQCTSLVIINSFNLLLLVDTFRSPGQIIDYSAIIGTVKTSTAINGKT